MKPAVQTFTLTPCQIARFWANVDRQADGCWIWRGHCFTNGYGKFNANHRTVCAHRVAWFLLNGPIPAGIQVLHRCDVHACVRADRHLFLGTQADNMVDMRTKRREARGDRHGMRTHPERRCYGERAPHAKLTADRVREIRRLHARGVKCCDLSHRFGVSHSQISRICSGTNWRHLGGAA